MELTLIIPGGTGARSPSITTAEQLANYRTAVDEVVKAKRHLAAVDER